MELPLLVVFHDFDEQHFASKAGTNRNDHECARWDWRNRNRCLLGWIDGVPGGFLTSETHLDEGVVRADFNVDRSSLRSSCWAANPRPPALPHYLIPFSRGIQTA